VGDALHDACLNVGIFYVTNHGVPTNVTDGVLAAARRWFALPVRAASVPVPGPTPHPLDLLPMTTSVYPKHCSPCPPARGPARLPACCRKQPSVRCRCPPLPTTAAGSAWAPM
jgi:hypothetical protein